MQVEAAGGVVTVLDIRRIVQERAEINPVPTRPGACWAALAVGNQLATHPRTELIMPFVKFVYCCFFLSGISGLMYQVVWLRILSRTTGVTIHATAIVVAAFMAGLAVGSLVLGRIIDKRKDPLRVYAALELLVGCTALLVPYAFSAAVPLYSHVYQVTQENVTITALCCGLVSFLTLLVPTALMGGTLPVMTACLVGRRALFGKSLSMLYGINTLGAVIGVVLSGFFTIGLGGERFTVYMAVAVNLMVAALAYSRYRREVPMESVPVSKDDEHTPAGPISPYSRGVRHAVLAAFAVSGLTSLAYEVIWTKQLILYLTNSIYAFAAMLAVFLTGISLGSMALSRASDRIERPLKYFGILELGVAWLSLGNIYLFPILGDPALPLMGDWYLRLAATAILVFPVTFLFGMILPLAGRCYAERTEKSGSGVGMLYGFNTLGCIAGSLLAGFLLVPAIGSTKTILILATANALLGLLLIWLDARPRLALTWVSLALCVLFGVTALNAAREDPFLDTIRRRISYLTSESAGNNPGQRPSGNIFFNQEGLEGTVTAFESRDGKHLWINGLGMTSLCTETKLMTHLPLALAKDPKEMLVVCFGMGTTVKSAIVYPGLGISAVELVSETFRLFPYYHPGIAAALNNANVRFIANDGRNHLLLSPKKYDVITVDPAPPVWSARTVNLYTSEFFRLCKERLHEGGVMCLWFPEASLEDNVSVATTFSSVFPYATIWEGPHQWGMYLIGTTESVPLKLVHERIHRMFANPNIVADLREYDQSCDTPEKLLALLRAREDQLAAGRDHRKGPYITDNHPYTEFFLGRRWEPW